jgi:DNA-binding NtrC family response regulator
MSARAVRLELTAAGCRAVRAFLAPSAAGQLRATRARCVPAVIAIDDSELPALRRLAELVVDRGRKHPAKSLGTKLFGQERIPLVAGSFRSCGQLVRSARTLLAHAVKRGERNLYLVGVETTLFGELWQRAEEGAPIEVGDSAQSTAASEPPSEGGKRAELDGLLARLPVPESIERQYVGGSPAVRLVHQLVVRAARRDEPVLVLGDTGTGKEVVARLIHEHGPRRRYPFTAVNCGAIPSELLESELFGQEPGSHSTATVRTLGLWRAAGQGTLFLDEIADLAPSHQVKILRALEVRHIRPVGGTREIRVRARVVAATNRDLYAMVRAGRFREDLYYRLRAFLIRTLPLREHPEDIPPLAAFFWRRITRDPDRRLPDEALAELSRLRWPGNARELRMVLSSLHSLFGDREIGVEHLRAVMDYEGNAAGNLPGEMAEASRHRIGCLRHLRRVDEALRACQVSLRPRQARGQVADPEETERILAERVSELVELCRHPLLFRGAALFALVSRLTDRLQALVFEKSTAALATRARRRALDADFALVSTALFEEMNELPEDD